MVGNENKKELSPAVDSSSAEEKKADLKQRAPALAGFGRSRKRPEIIIYTMPKRFLGATVGSGHKARGIGILIIAFGAIILIVGFAFVYFYFTKFNKEPFREETNVSRPAETSTTTERKTAGLNEAKTKTKTTRENKQLSGQTKAEEKKEEKTGTTKRIVIATSTSSAGAGRSTAKETSAASTTARAFKPAADTDNDALTDVEEALL